MKKIMMSMLNLVEYAIKNESNKKLTERSTKKALLESFKKTIRTKI